MAIPMELKIPADFRTDGCRGILITSGGATDLSARVATSCGPASRFTQVGNCHVVRGIAIALRPHIHDLDYFLMKILTGIAGH